MILGSVNTRLEASVVVVLRGPTGIESKVETIIDTGFTDAITMPAGLVMALGLVRQSSGTAMLADGTVCQFDYWLAEIEWSGTWRKVLVSTVGDEPLLGMQLLANHKLEIEVRFGGTVQISPIP